MSITVELTFDQLLHAVEQLSPGQRETLEILLDPELSRTLQQRRTQARREAASGQLLTPEELFEGLE